MHENCLRDCLPHDEHRKSAQKSWPLDLSNPALQEDEGPQELEQFILKGYKKASGETWKDWNTLLMRTWGGEAVSQFAVAQELKKTNKQTKTGTIRLSNLKGGHKLVAAYFHTKLTRVSIAVQFMTV